MSLTERINEIMNAETEVKASRIRLLEEAGFGDTVRSEKRQKLKDAAAVYYSKKRPDYITYGAILVEYRNLLSDPISHLTKTVYCSSSFPSMGLGGQTPFGFMGPTVFSSSMIQTAVTSVVSPLSAYVGARIADDLVKYAIRRIKVEADLSFDIIAVSNQDEDVLSCVKQVHVITVAFDDLTTFEKERRAKVEEIESVIRSAIIKDHYPDYASLSAYIELLAGKTDDACKQVEALIEHAALAIEQKEKEAIAAISAEVDTATMSRINELKKEIEELYLVFKK